MERIAHSVWYHGGAGPHYPKGLKTIELELIGTDDFCWCWSASGYSGQNYEAKLDAIVAASTFLREQGWTDDLAVAQKQAEICQSERAAKHEAWW